MKKEVIVLDSDEEQCLNLCALLTDHTYSTTPMNNMSKMNQYFDEIDCRAIILNLDSISATNKILRDLKRKNPLVNIIAFSERQYHPELEEALRDYISVCLAKPVDPDELFYWLRCIFKNNEETPV